MLSQRLQGGFQLRTHCRIDFPCCLLLKGSCYLKCMPYNNLSCFAVLIGCAFLGTAAASTR